MIGANLAFGIGWSVANQSGSSLGKSCRKIMWKNLAKKSCRKFWQENLAGQGGGEKANLRKAVIGGNLAFGIVWWGANQSGYSLRKSCRKILWENLTGNSCGKMLQENVAGNSCIKILQENLVRQGGGKKANLRNYSDWWKFSIWKRVLGSQPIRIQLGKILHKNLARKSCGKFLRENLVGQGGGEKETLRKAVIGGNLAFGIGWWGANQSGSSWQKSCGKILQENLGRKSCGKILWENLVGKSCGTGRRGKSQFKKGSD